ncbi:unnamed protein product, partial [Dovyalis caffra]
HMSFSNFHSNSFEMSSLITTNSAPALSLTSNQTNTTYTSFISSLITHNPSPKTPTTSQKIFIRNPIASSHVIPNHHELLYFPHYTSHKTRQGNYKAPSYTLN